MLNDRFELLIGKDRRPSGFTLIQTILAIALPMMPYSFGIDAQEGSDLLETDRVIKSSFLPEEGTASGDRLPCLRTTLQYSCSFENFT
jgi:hypothetical protein